MARNKSKHSISNDLTAIKVILAELEQRLRKIKQKAGENDMADITSITAKINALNAGVDELAAKHTGGISATDAQTIEDALSGVVTKIQAIVAAP
jgi:hypothetical protein